VPAAARGRLRTNTADKPWADAIRVAAMEKASGSKSLKLRIIAEKTVDMAMAGDMEAIKEIGNRLDGKAKQQHDVDLNLGAEFLSVLEASRERARKA
jgi:hypothetical protein